MRNLRSGLSKVACHCDTIILSDRNNLSQASGDWNFTDVNNNSNELGGKNLVYLFIYFEHVCVVAFFVILATCAPVQGIIAPSGGGTRSFSLYLAR